MSKLFKVKKASLGIAMAATVIMTSFGSYNQAYAAAPGAGKEYVEPDETPKQEETVSQTPVLEEPKQEEVAPQTPAVEAPKQEEVAPQTPVVEEPKQEDVVPQTPVVEEPKQEETVPQAPAVEEPKQEETVPQAPAVEAPKQEDVVPQTPVVEESKQNEVKDEVKDEVYTVDAPKRIYNQDWSINPNDWTYTDTQWTDGTATVEGHYGSEAEVQKMYELINEYRIANGKQPLTYNTKMDTCMHGANERAITSANYWEHWSYRFSENIAYTPVFYSGYDDMEMVEKVFEAWIDSPGHRSNILNAGSTNHQTAISVFYKKVEGGYERYWVQCFR